MRHLSGSVSSPSPSSWSASTPMPMPMPNLIDPADDTGTDVSSVLSECPPTSSSSFSSQISRASSTPLMPAFMVSAPGKVIVYGEHAVVHKKPAIAASISLRSYLLVHFLSKSHRTVSLLFPDIGLSHSWDIGKLPWDAFNAPGKKKTYYDSVTDLDPDLVSALQPFIDEVGIDALPDRRKIHHSSAFAFLYLFLSLGSPSSPSCVYTLRSTIPIGAGLGSSASISVCLSCALLLQIRALSGPHPDQPALESAVNVERINQWAFVAEMCIHGNPSGVDNTVSSGGKAVFFQRNDRGRPSTVRRLQSFPELPLLLVNTKQSRSTLVEVKKVSDLLQQHPKIASSVLDAIGDITQTALDLITSPDFSSQDHQTLETLGKLASINHGLLVSLGVSHPRLERIRELVDHAGVGWTKLTGAGGGGCAITILRPQPSLNGTIVTAKSSENTNTVHETSAIPNPLHPPIPSSLRRSFDDEQFEYFTTTLAGDGVGVLWPAVLRNGYGEEGGEEIDQEKFLNAKGNEGIERLVGVSNAGVGMAIGEWKFWRV